MPAVSIWLVLRSKSGLVPDWVSILTCCTAASEPTSRRLMRVPFAETHSNSPSSASSISRTGAPPFGRLPARDSSSEQYRLTTAVPDLGVSATIVLSPVRNLPRARCLAAVWRFGCGSLSWHRRFAIPAGAGTTIPQPTPIRRPQCSGSASEDERDEADILLCPYGSIRLCARVAAAGQVAAHF